MNNGWLKQGILAFVGLLSLWGSFAGTLQAEEKKFKIVLFQTRAEGDAFWGPVERFMKAASNDLGMELQTHYAHDSLPEMTKQLRESVNANPKPDAVAIMSFKKGGHRFIQIANEANVPLFLFNSGVDYAEAGKPRERYKSWIGEMLPDDEGAGFNLANVLADAAKKAGKLGKDGKVHLVGVNGIISDAAAIERAKGLERAARSRDDLVLHQIVPANWEFEKAKQVVPELLKRYPETSVIWAASDVMATAVVVAGRELKLKPNEDFFTGGVDWAAEGIQSVAKGEMTATAGGHFMEGGWVAVLLYDYLSGLDFAPEALQMKSEMSLLTKETLGAYQQKFGKGDWEAIDFKKFSKKFNPTLPHYPFGLQAIMGDL